MEEEINVLSDYKNDLVWDLVARSNTVNINSISWQSLVI
jgi:hypothetical protein